MLSARQIRTIGSHASITIQATVPYGPHDNFDGCSNIVRGVPCKQFRVCVCLNVGEAVQEADRINFKRQCYSA